MARIDLADRLAGTRGRLHDEASESPEDLPLFATLVRKEARVRDDQLVALAALSKALMRRRRLKGERITDNTLIRVAIDLLLLHQDSLAGANESELRMSVTPELRSHQTSGALESRGMGSGSHE